MEQLQPMTAGVKNNIEETRQKPFLVAKIPGKCGSGCTFKCLQTIICSAYVKNAMKKGSRVHKEQSNTEIILYKKNWITMSTMYE